jgi:hypothetical protein
MMNANRYGTCMGSSIHYRNNVVGIQHAREVSSQGKRDEYRIFYTTKHDKVTCRQGGFDRCLVSSN